jgi:hypothetical protein
MRGNCCTSYRLTLTVCMFVTHFHRCFLNMSSLYPIFAIHDHYTPSPGYHHHQTTRRLQLATKGAFYFFFHKVLARRDESIMHFTDEMLYSFSDCLKKWILEHPEMIAKLLGCIYAVRTMVSSAPALLGFGALGPAGGELHHLQPCELPHLLHVTNEWARYSRCHLSSRSQTCLCRKCVRHPSIGSYGRLWCRRPPEDCCLCSFGTQRCRCRFLECDQGLCR